jgi:hypothetical protein
MALARDEAHPSLHEELVLLVKAGLNTDGSTAHAFLHFRGNKELPAADTDWRRIVGQRGSRRFTVVGYFEISGGAWRSQPKCHPNSASATMISSAISRSRFIKLSLAFAYAAFLHSAASNRATNSELQRADP